MYPEFISTHLFITITKDTLTWLGLGTHICVSIGAALFKESDKVHCFRCIDLKKFDLEQCVYECSFGSASGL